MIFASWLVGLTILYLQGCHGHESSSSSSDESNNIPINFGAAELQSLRDEIEFKILANNDGLTLDSDLVDPLDVLGPNDLVLIASFIRLIFHDCGGSGICDGCIDIENSENGGLYEGAILPLQSICQEYKEEYELSFADCWALAATFAVEISQERTDSEWEAITLLFPLVGDAYAPTQSIFGGDIPYYVGRTDSNKCNGYGIGDSNSLDEELPDAHLGWSHASQYMLSKFPNLTYKEIVALIAGGHSIGRGHGRISGYTGPWDASANVIDNDYCRELKEPIDRFGTLLNWESGKIFNQDNAESQFFVHGNWTSFGLPQNDLFLMLNCDIELAYDLSYYIENDLLDNIDCSIHAIEWCAVNEAGSTVLYAGETEQDGVTYCTAKQCPYKCNDETTFNQYINSGYQDIPNNGDCPAAWVWQFAESDDEFGQTFASGFTKMITAGYDVDQDLKQLYL